jgi:hypothetical protein
MYNLLVNANERAWELPFCEYSWDRFLEPGLTAQYIMREIEGLGETEKLTHIKNYPALFLYETGIQKDAQFGFIKEIKENRGTFRLDVEYCGHIKLECLHAMQADLDLKHPWNHTHTAVKDVDLFAVLKKHKIDGSEEFVRRTFPLSRKYFDVAFSFPGEKREKIKDIVNELKLKGKYSIFYDEDFTSELAVPGMDLSLMNIYRKQSKLICVFLCSEYETKKWCKLEWRSIREILDERIPENIMFFRFDDTEIPGVSSNDGYIDVNKYTVPEIAQFIAKRLELPG